MEKATPKPMQLRTGVQKLISWGHEGEYPICKEASNDVATIVTPTKIYIVFY